MLVEDALLLWNYLLYIFMIETNSNYTDVLRAKISSRIESRCKHNTKEVQEKPHSLKSELEIGQTNAFFLFKHIFDLYFPA